MHPARSMSVETKQNGTRSLGSRMSNESFITLFMVGVLVVLFGIACAIVPNFYLPQNMLNLLTNNWFIIIIGIGVTFLLITGNFDMSVGGVIALTGVLSVYFCQGANVSQNALANGLGLPYGVAVSLALLCALGIGALNAFFIARLKVPSIIVTLGTMMLARGIAQVVTLGAQRNTSLPDVFGVVGNMSIQGTSIKISVLIMIVLLVAAFIFEKMTVSGRRTYLIGANPVAARLSGIKVGRHLTSLYLISALPGGHHGDPPGLRVQGGGVRPCHRLRVRRPGGRPAGRGQHCRRVRLGARDVRRRGHPLRRDHVGDGAPVVARLAVHPEGGRHIHRDPRAALRPG